MLPDGVLSNPDTEYVRLTLEVFMVTAFSISSKWLGQKGLRLDSSYYGLAGMVEARNFINNANIDKRALRDTGMMESYLDIETGQDGLFGKRLSDVEACWLSRAISSEQQTFRVEKKGYGAR